MDWITLLRSQQADFIARLKSGCLLKCETQGQHSELTVISGRRIEQLRNFCWEMTDKYKRNSPARKVFIDNLKGKLGEVVVKARLTDFVTEVDYEKRFGGDGKVDFRLTSDPSIGIQVKARHGSIDTIRWEISQEEIEKNAALVCILIQEEVNEAQAEYNLIMAGFLPTNMIDVNNGKTLIRIEELLYCSGLHSYLASLTSQNKYQRTESQPEISLLDYFSIGNSCYEQGDYQSAITNYNQALQLNPNYAEAYFWRGSAYYARGNKLSAIEDFNRGLRINPNNAMAYNNRGVILSDTGDKLGAIDNFNQAIRLNPKYAKAYCDRGNTQANIGEKQGAIEDYTQAIKINPKYAKVYYERGNVFCIIGNKQRAIEDFKKAANLYLQQGNQAEYQKARTRINTIFAKELDFDEIPF